MGKDVQDVLILGDFNDKSTLWGFPRTNPRGEAVAEWATELDLRLLNEGSKNTCVRWQGESIVDLTWASPSAARKVKNWRVAIELRSLSYHRYIIIRLLPGGREANHDKGERQRGRDREKRQEDPHQPRWAIRKLNQDRLLTAAHAAAWTASWEETESPDAESQAKWFQTQIVRISNMAEKHRKRKRTRNNDEEEQLRLRYRAAVVALEQAIRDAKSRAWDKLLKTMDRDPWGRFYSLVLSKLRPTAPSPSHGVNGARAARVGSGHSFPSRPWTSASGGLRPD